MRQVFVKGDDIRSLEVYNGRVLGISIVKDGWRIGNPTLEDFLADGWSYLPEPEPYLPTYSELVEEYIRDNGYPTYGAELAVLNNYAMNPEDTRQAYQHYMDIRQMAKEWAETQPHREESNE